MASGKVRIIYRDFPLPQHQYARKAAQYAGAAARIGRYGASAMRCSGRRRSGGGRAISGGSVGKTLTPAELAQLHKVLADPQSLAEINREIDADMALGAKIPLSETPTMIVSGGGKRYPIKGDIRYDYLKKLIDSLPVK